MSTTRCVACVGQFGAQCSEMVHAMYLNLPLPWYCALIPCTGFQRPRVSQLRIEPNSFALREWQITQRKPSETLKHCVGTCWDLWEPVLGVGNPLGVG